MKASQYTHVIRYASLGLNGINLSICLICLYAKISTRLLKDFVKSLNFVPANNSDLRVHCSYVEHSQYLLLISTGTIRRFLEHYGDEIDLVVFVSDQDDVS